MKKIAIALAVALLFAVPAAAQEPEPEPEPDPRRVTVGVSARHYLSVWGGSFDSEPVPLGLHVGYRFSDRFGVHADIVQRRERQGLRFGEESPGVVRTLRWWTGGAVFHLADKGRVRPHLLTGVELLIDSTNRCALLRREYPGDDCQNFPHRRGGVNAGLGVDIPVGRWVFARIQYVTSVIYVYDAIGISHSTRLVAGVRF